MELLRRLGLMGRTTRATLLGFLLLSGIASAAALFLFTKTSPWTNPTAFASAQQQAWRSVLNLVLDLIFLWLSVLRFHDQDRPGWLALIPAALAAAAALGLPVPGVIAVIVFLGVLVALFLPGTIGPNRYGPDPYGWESSEHYLEERRQGRAN